MSYPTIKIVGFLMRILDKTSSIQVQELDIDLVCF